MNADIDRKLLGGATAITPNRRLARALHRQYSSNRRTSGLSVWETPTILPWRTWLESLWAELGSSANPAHLRQGQPPLRLMSRVQTEFLWNRIVARDSAARDLLNATGAARHASEAWQLLHAWGTG